MFRKLLFIFLLISLPINVYSQIYYSAGDSLWMLTPEDDPVYLAETEDTAYHLTVDTTSNYIYWTLPNTSNTLIERMHPDDAEKELVLELDYSARGIVVDSKAGKLYWAKLTNKGAIYRANLDGSEVEIVVDGDQEGNPTNGILDLDLDIENEKIYWSKTGMIMSSKMDGTEIDTVKEITSYIQPFGLSLNNRDAKLYWINTFPDAIVEVDLLTGEQKNIISSSRANGVSVNLSENKIYWVDYVSSTNQDGIFRANLDGTNTEKIADTDFSRGAHFVLGWDISTSVEQGLLSDDIPSYLNLLQNYPNPFNPTTVIQYELIKADKVTVEIFNSAGQRVELLLDGKVKQSGNHSLVFNGKNLPSGIYYYRLKTTDETVVKKMTLIK